MHQWSACAPLLGVQCAPMMSISVHFVVCTYDAQVYTLYIVCTMDAPMVGVCPITRCDPRVQSRHQAISEATGIFTAIAPDNHYPTIPTIIILSLPIIAIIISQSSHSSNDIGKKGVFHPDL